MSVFEAVERDLKRMGPKAENTALAATALALASELDGPNRASAKSMCAKELRETLRDLMVLAPEREEPDSVDDILAARERRLARLAAS